MKDATELGNEYAEALKKGFNPVIIATEKTIKRLGDLRPLSLGESGLDAAKFFYLRLHQAEEEYDYIIIERMPETGVYYSVMNRAKKSAAD